MPLYTVKIALMVYKGLGTVDISVISDETSTVLRFLVVMTAIAKWRISRFPTATYISCFCFFSGKRNR